MTNSLFGLNFFKIFNFTNTIPKILLLICINLFIVSIFKGGFNKVFSQNSNIIKIYLLFSSIIIINDLTNFMKFKEVYIVNVLYIFCIFVVFYIDIIDNIGKENSNDYIYKLYKNRLLLWLSFILILLSIKDAIFNPNDGTRLIDFFLIDNNKNNYTHKNKNLLNNLLNLLIINYFILISIYIINSII
jgi:hypothetical protein|tara:strand:+ start:341 stop:904 length:564 start_codon:yes stop_codon:yes gene_type:complete